MQSKQSMAENGLKLINIKRRISYWANWGYTKDFIQIRKNTTKRAAEQHCYKVYFQIQTWLGKNAYSYGLGENTEIMA